MTTEQPSGLLLIDKPVGITSFDVIRRLRRQIGLRKIGHAGTLDPLASGLMLMLIGTATKQASHLIKLDKYYLAELTLGVVSSTGDAEGDKTTVSANRPTEAQLGAVLNRFTGEITQTPPIYSAIKVAGREAYKYARAGQAVELPSRQVTVSELALIDYDYPRVALGAAVSSGTYIRSLANDIGGVLGTGAYLSSLRRTVVGPYRLDEARSLADVTDLTDLRPIA